MTKRAKIRMMAAQARRLKSLMHMRYTPAELADELGVSIQWIRRTCLSAGAPHQRDQNGRIWIVGDHFAKWARQALERKRTMAEGEAWCFLCKKPVEMAGPLEVRRSNRYLETVRGQCPECGTTVVRGKKRDKP